MRLGSALSQVAALLDASRPRPPTSGTSGIWALSPSGTIVGGFGTASDEKDRDAANVLVARARVANAEITTATGRVLVSKEALGFESAVASLRSFLSGGPSTLKLSGADGEQTITLLPSTYSGPLLVSDIDDTLRDGSLRNLFSSDGGAPFRGADAVLEHVARSGVPLLYLSASPELTRANTEKFLQHFPAGAFVSRSTLGLADLNPDRGTQARAQAQFKDGVLAQLRTLFPNAHLLGLGDNRFGDAFALERANHAGDTFLRNARPESTHYPANAQPLLFEGHHSALTDAIAEAVATRDRRSGIDRTIADIESLTGVVSTTDNSVELLVDELAANQILADIDRETKSIFYEAYKFADDARGEQIADALIRAHQRGVDVRVTVDGFGSRVWPIVGNDQVNRMREAGIEVRVFNPLTNLEDLIQIRRDHRKVIVVGDTLYVGGMNTSSEYMGSPAEGAAHDVFTRIRGSAALAGAMSVLQTWKHVGGSPLEFSPELYAQNAANRGDVQSWIIPHVPGEDRNDERAYLAMIDNAEKSIHIANGYALSAGIVDALCAAAQRGVDVTYTVGDEPGTVFAMASKNLDRLQAFGVNVQIYPGHLHTKILVVDETLGSVGSSNFDNVSFHRNWEIIGVHRGGDIVRDLVKMLERDARGAHAWNASEGRWDRLAPSEPWTEERARAMAWQTWLGKAVPDLFE